MYVISINELEKGDILLTAENSATSKVVRKSTGSSFSHTILYIGSGTYIHSDANGVHSGNMQRLLFDTPENVTILRVAGSPDQLRKACMFARLKIGTKYSIRNAINSKLKTTTKERKNRQFCSRLVVQSYESAGIKLVENTSFCTPQEILESKLVQKTSVKIRKATIEEVAISQSKNPLNKQSSIINGILRKVRTITKEDIQTLEQVTHHLINNPKDDREISDVYKRSGYLTMWKYDIEENPWRYDGKKLLEIPLSKVELIQLATSERDNAIDRLMLYKHNFDQYFYINETHRLEYSQMKFKLYHQLLKNTFDNLDAANHVLKNI
ncbi:YiiX/YebB-like N1pC/P60 family cysteine hydrolase [Pantoea sp. PNT03]|jgi:hypothetical protein|uniref:YiiX/YebB-like N1pC/P60 family cysteine hydrolase n=1 Tax=Pantoea sp. PNT03 TaxID=2769258 RepID=UPI00177E7956|nr:YiiX/YebB-like N1pC/P60 family cysteine hydrolase [Pantoea sp. PNT03]MBD9658514.1 hypothetical protein [Pantoea sp. PNT03]